MSNASIYNRVSRSAKGLMAHTRRICIRTFLFKEIEILKRFLNDFSPKNFNQAVLKEALNYLEANGLGIDYFYFRRYIHLSVECTLGP